MHFENTVIDRIDSALIKLFFVTPFTVICSAEYKCPYSISVYSKITGGGLALHVVFRSVMLGHSHISEMLGLIP